MANFNMLYPFPGTPAYRHLQQSGRLLFDRWWMSPQFRWDFPAFRPEKMTPEELASSIRNARRRFSSISSLIRRGMDFSANFSDPVKACLYLTTNLVSRADISRKTDLRPGLPGCAISGENNI